MVDLAAVGQGSWATVLGEAGIGKSRLVAETRRRVEDRGGYFVVGRCSPVDSATPFRPLAEALMGAARSANRPEDVAELGPYLPAVERFVPHWRDGATTFVSESPAVVGESVLRVLSWLAGGKPMLVAFEDLHWADPDTVAVCEYLVDHLDGTTVMVMATARRDELPSATVSLVQRGRTVELAPLSAAQVVSMAAACLGAPASAEVVDRVVAVADGLPLLVEDLIGAGGSVRFDELVGARVDDLKLSSRRLVVAAALFGEFFDLPRLALSVGVGETAAAEDLRVLIAAQLVRRDVGGFRFRHALTRDAVLASASEFAVALAAGVAQALEVGGRDDDLATAAQLWAQAGDPGRSCKLLQAAAGAAVRRGAPMAAIELFSRAAQMAPDRPTRTKAQLALLDLLVAHGHVIDAMSLGASLLDTTDGAEPACRFLARALLDAGRVEEAGTYLDALREGAERLVLTARATLAGSSSDRRITAEHLAHQAVAAAAREDTPAMVCEALEIVARCARSRSLADAESVLRRALTIAETSELAGVRLRLLNELGTVEMLRSADGSRLRRALSEALGAGALDVAVGTRVNIAALHAMRGELDNAKSEAEEAESMAARLGLQPLVAAAMVIWALSDGLRGRREEMERRLRVAEDLSPHDADLAALAWGVGRAFCALLREERDDAITALQRAVQPDLPVGSLDTARGPLLAVLAANGEATADDLEHARAVATPGASWSDMWLGYGQAALGRDLEAFQSADIAARRHPLFRAVGLRLVAEAALRDQWGDPVAWLRDADAFFVAAGLNRIAGACEALLKQAGAPIARRRGVDRALPSKLLRAGVTTREAEVLELVGERLGNKEIASRLFVSPRTVEKHVASLVLKLAAADRAALARIARHE